MHRQPPLAVGAQLQQAVLQVRVPRQPGHAAALGAVARDAGQHLGERSLVFVLEHAGHRARAVAKGEGVRDGGVRGVREGAEAAAGGQNAGGRLRSNWSKLVFKKGPWNPWYISED